MIRKLKNIGRIIRTVSHLKPIQVAYQLRYRLIPAKSLLAYSSENSTYRKLKFFQTPEINLVKFEEKKIHFTFLNLSQTFKDQVDWNFQDFGKLWNYNLQYMDWLKQSSLEIDTKNDLALNLYKHLWNGNLVLEPYPASLRIMNGIRFLSIYDQADSRFFKFIKAEANFLSSRLEYHLLANHLLENAFAIYMAGTFFNEEKWINLGENLLMKELNEQILEDGAHYELSPMYHQIIFFRVLELLAYENPSSTLAAFILRKAEKMLAWLRCITFKNGTVPHFNDSTDSIALTSQQLFEIANELNLKNIDGHKLTDSGYRKFENKNFELIVDYHGISPKYQPGHAHADTFSFCLNYKSENIIVDPGITTYDSSIQRMWERSTIAHNTVSLEFLDSSEIWSSFRVGRRAKVEILNETSNSVEGYHKGYNVFKSKHKRCIEILDKTLFIFDEITGASNKKGYFRIFFNHNIKLIVDKNTIYLRGLKLKIEFSSNEKFKVELKDYNLSEGFNKHINSTFIQVEFFQCLKTEMKLD